MTSGSVKKEKTMENTNTKAIYTIREHNRDYHFFTYHAGGYSFPFVTARTIINMHFVLNDSVYLRCLATPLSAAALLPQLTGNSNYPDDAKGQSLFREISETEAAGYLDRTIHGDEIPFHITIDVDRRTVLFALNPLCRKTPLPEIGIPIYSDTLEPSGSAFENTACLALHAKEDDRPAWRIREDIYHEGLERYDQVLNENHDWQSRELRPHTSTCISGISGGKSNIKIMRRMEETVRGLTDTAIEKACVMGRDANTEIAGLRDMVSELVSFWELDEHFIDQFDMDVGEVMDSVSQTANGISHCLQ